MLEEIKRATVGQEFILIVTLKSVFDTWERHFDLIFDDIQPSTIAASKRGKDPIDIPAYIDDRGRMFVLTNWENVGREEYQRIKWSYIVADEAHFAKNRNAARTKNLKKLRGDRKNPPKKRALTGTPIINEPAEVWSILNWLFPRRYTSYWRFFHQHVKHEHHTKGECEVEDCGQWHQREFRVILGPKNKKALRQELGQYTLRRLKKNHLKDLPDKFYTKRYVTLNAQQKKVYKDMAADALAWVGEFENIPLPAPQAIAQLGRLRQIASATPVKVDHVERMVKGELKQGIKVTLGDPSPKIDEMMNIIAETNQQVVVFAESSQLIELAVARLNKAKVPTSMIIGDVSTANRKKEINKFRQGETRVFAATIKSAGVGVDGLQVASIAIFLERAWSPAQNWQAEDRLHRDGQKNGVEIINILCKDTVDDQVEEKLELKASWFRAILGG